MQDQDVQMFDLTEKVILDYLQYMLKLDSLEEMIQNPDDAKIISRPTNIIPIDNYDLALTLCILDTQDVADKQDIDEKKSILPHMEKSILPYRDNPQVQQYVQYVKYCLERVYSVVVSHSLKPSITQELINKYSFDLVLDRETLSFYPRYIDPVRKKKMIYLELIHNFEYLRQLDANGNSAWDELTDKLKQEYMTRVYKAKEIIEGLPDEDTKDMEDAINADYSKLKRIGFLVDKIPREVPLEHNVPEVENNQEILEEDNRETIPKLEERSDNSWSEASSISEGEFEEESDYEDLTFDYVKPQEEPNEESDNDQLLETFKDYKPKTFGDSLPTFRKSSRSFTP